MIVAKRKVFTYSSSVGISCQELISAITDCTNFYLERAKQFPYIQMHTSSLTRLELLKCKVGSFVVCLQEIPKLFSSTNKLISLTYRCMHLPFLKDKVGRSRILPCSVKIECCQEKAQDQGQQR